MKRILALATVFSLTAALLVSCVNSDKPTANDETQEPVLRGSEVLSSAGDIMAETKTPDFSSPSETAPEPPTEDAPTAPPATDEPAEAKLV